MTHLILNASFIYETKITLKIVLQRITKHENNNFLLNTNNSKSYFKNFYGKFIL